MWILYARFKLDLDEFSSLLKDIAIFIRLSPHMLSVFYVIDDLMGLTDPTGDTVLIPNLLNRAIFTQNLLSNTSMLRQIEPVTDIIL